MTVLVTGVAGFIGMHVALALLARGDAVVGVDDLNGYYDSALKRARLARLLTRPGFVFHPVDAADPAALGTAAAHAGVDRPAIDRVVHLAAQPGVRHSLEAPFAYTRANVDGQLAVLELCRRLPGLRHLVYASSSAVYGRNTKLPFAVGDPVDSPASLYGATKRAGELMAESYAHLFAIPATGLRFFTVYGPWGRPDMAPYLFARAITDGTPIRVFNRGAMKRDFTYVDDIAAGVLACLDRPPEGSAPHRLYNLGNSRSEPLLRFIAVMEQALGRRAVTDLQPMQPGDVHETFADIGPAQRDFGYAPTTPIEDGVPRFVAWFRAYHGL